MTIRLLIVPVLLGWGLLLPALGMQRVDQQLFDLPEGGTVIVDAYRGFINVVPGPGSAVVVSVKYVSDQTSPDEARTALDALQLKMEQVGQNIVITSRNPRETGVRFIWEDLSRLMITYELQVPAHCNLDLTTNDGSVTVGSLKGTMRARTETGGIFFRQVDGDVDARAQSGSVVVSRCTGSVHLQTVSGDVRVGTVGGRAQLETVNGDIEVQTARGTVQAFTTEGNVTAGFAEFSGGSRIKTSVGNITATINPAESCSIRAKSFWGKIYNQLDVEPTSGGNGKSRLRGDYKGGGPLIDLDASGGYVRIQGGEPMFDR